MCICDSLFAAQMLQAGPSHGGYEGGSEWVRNPRYRCAGTRTTSFLGTALPHFIFWTQASRIYLPYHTRRQHHFESKIYHEEA